MPSPDRTDGLMTLPEPIPTPVCSARSAVMERPTFEEYIEMFQAFFWFTFMSLAAFAGWFCAAFSIACLLVVGVDIPALIVLYMARIFNHATGTHLFENMPFMVKL